MYNILKEHIGLLWLMFNHCKKLQISLNLKKCIFCVPFGNLLGHIVCKEGVLVNPTKVVVILNIPPLTTYKKLWPMLGNGGYYRIFIRNYARITTHWKSF
jgi:hypothetical protein